MNGKWLILASVAILTACGSGGPPVPDWKSDSVDFIERYKKHALIGENLLAERYFHKALRATAGAGRVRETGRLWLVRCATRRASLLDDNCSEYAELANVETTEEDRAYYQFLTLNWNSLNARNLPAQYAGLINADPTRIHTQVAAIADPLSRLLAASLVTLKGQADRATLIVAMETASAQGWRQPLLTYLRLLEKSASARGAVSEQQEYALRIRLIEEALRTPPARQSEVYK